MSRIKTAPAGVRVQVKFQGETIADSKDAVRLEEGSYAPVFYVPRKDVKMERLARTSHKTHCPYKGDASYYSIKDGPENAVWSYEAPIEGMGEIRELLAFYPSKVEISAG